jgi:hypothetical protein
VSPAALLGELSRAGFMAYPTRFPEVGCVSVMKAMVAGCIPVTSRYTNSVLRPAPAPAPGPGPGPRGAGDDMGVGVTAEFDLGPAIPYSDNLNYSDWLQKEWVPAVVRAYWVARGNGTRGGGGGGEGEGACTDALQAHREQMQQYAAAAFSWRESARRMEQLFFERSEGWLEQ